MFISCHKMLGHIARTVEMRIAHKVLVGEPESKRPLEDLCVAGKIILDWTFRN
jgi:hypothetical protein